nr:hypothetical protein [Mycolicibacterium tusciae]
MIQRRSLNRRQVGEHIDVDICQQVRQCRKREVHLAGRAMRRKHLEALGVGKFDSVAVQRGLADTGFAFDKQSDRAGSQIGQQCHDGLPLCRAHCRAHEVALARLLTPSHSVGDLPAPVCRTAPSAVPDVG